MSETFSVTGTPILSALPPCTDDEVWFAAVRHRMGLVGVPLDREYLEKQIRILDGPTIYDTLLAEHRLDGRLA